VVERFASCGPAVQSCLLPLAVPEPISWVAGLIVRQQLSQSNGMHAICCGVIRRT